MPEIGGLQSFVEGNRLDRRYAITSARLLAPSTMDCVTWAMTVIG